MKPKRKNNIILSILSVLVLLSGIYYWNRFTYSDSQKILIREYETVRILGFDKTGNMSRFDDCYYVYVEALDKDGNELPKEATKTRRHAFQNTLHILRSPDIQIGARGKLVAESSRMYETVVFRFIPERK